MGLLSESGWGDEGGRDESVREGGDGGRWRASLLLMVELKRELVDKLSEGDKVVERGRKERERLSINWRRKRRVGAPSGLGESGGRGGNPWPELSHPWGLHFTLYL